MQTKPSEDNLLRNWRVKLALLFAIITPTITATGAFYDLKSSVNDRVSALELRSEQTYADKQTLKEIQQEQRSMHDDIISIKVLLDHKFSK